jgi:metacaspase-1
LEDGTPRGVSIHVGLNRVDPDHYLGWDGELLGCEFDANDMAELAAASGLQTQTLLTEEARAKGFVSAMENASQTLKSGDLLVLTFSGHGGQVPDTNTSHEQDRVDETWALYDRQVVDDELFALLARFKAGVRIAIFIDSSVSGTVARAAFEPPSIDRLDDLAVESDQPRIKGMPVTVIRSVYESSKQMYDAIQHSLPPFDEIDVAASVIFTSGCQPNQTSLDGERNGLFTQTLLQVWDEGAFSGSYVSFHKRIAQNMPPWQSPNLFTVGTGVSRFASERPFTV